MSERLLSRPGDKVLHREPGYMIVGDADGRQFQFWWNDSNEPIEPQPIPPGWESLGFTSLDGDA